MPVSRPRGRTLLLRGLICLTATAGIWVLVVSLSGGFRVELGSLTLSSRSPRDPLLALLLLLGAVWALTPAGARMQTLRDEGLSLQAAIIERTRLLALTSKQAGAIAAAFVLLLAAATTWLGLARGALVAGGADSYGYVSQAHLWASGTLRLPQPLLEHPPDGIPQEALAPLGYRLSPQRDVLVPFYAPGLPMTMALLTLAGGSEAVFVAMPLLAGVAVWATWAIGVAVGGTRVGVGAALLLATSPAFVFQLTHAPMSDIPATAWWAAALLLASRPSRWAALAAGLATSAAILTRPNLVPLAAVPGAMLLWRTHANRAAGLQLGSPLLFAAGAIPGVATVAALNAYWYGSPFGSGYGTLGGVFYRWEHFGANVRRYPAWLFESQGPLIAAAAAAPFLLWRRSGDRSDATDRGSLRQAAAVPRTMLAACVAFVTLTYACYAYYLPFDAWWVLRFLVPAFPALFVLTSAALFDIASRIPWRARTLAGPALIAVMVLHAIGFSRDNAAYDSSDEWRYATAGRYIAARFPERAIFLAMLHSGSIRLYSGRMTVRFDVIRAESLPTAIDGLRRLGYMPYFVIDDGEREEFTRRFGALPLVRLDVPPVARVDGVSIYEVVRR